MVALEETISILLVVTEEGTIRIKGSRVSLDSIVHHFKLGATAEQIVQSFPSLSLGDVYSSIAYYLTHRSLLLRVPTLDVITAHQVDLSNASDPELLAWAAEHEQVVVTHKGRTMPYHATSRIAKAERAGIVTCNSPVMTRNDLVPR